MIPDTVTISRGTYERLLNAMLVAVMTHQTMFAVAERDEDWLGMALQAALHDDHEKVLLQVADLL